MIAVNLRTQVLLEHSLDELIKEVELLSYK